MMTAPYIREYHTTDKERCLEIFDSNLPQYFMKHERDEFITWLDKADKPPYYVMQQENKIVACGGIYKDEEQNVTGLAWGMVDNALHQEGYGKLLTQHRIQVMHELYPNAEQHLQTSQHTVAFYEKLGFKTVEVTKDGFGEGMDSYKMRANYEDLTKAT